MRSYSLFESFVPGLRLLFLMWLLFTIDFYLPVDVALYLGILPRTLWGLVGIFTAPLVHGSYLHLLSNTFPFLILSAILFYMHSRIASRVFSSCYLLTGALVWIFGRENIHIGASGVIYGIAFFLISFGFIRKDFKSLFISFVVLLLYGGLFWGLLPMQPGVSVESHLLGAVVGILNAVAFGRMRNV